MLQMGDRAPDFTVLAAVGGDVTELTLDDLLKSRRGVVLHTYVLDFTGG
jgi:peroxiredoxin